MASGAGSVDALTEAIAEFLAKGLATVRDVAGACRADLGVLGSVLESA
jgi:hypothetical protein